MAATPDISCSPIISPDQEGEEQGKSKAGEGETERKTSTSTPLGIFSSQLHNLYWKISLKKTIKFSATQLIVYRICEENISLSEKQEDHLTLLATKTNQEERGGAT